MTRYSMTMREALAKVRGETLQENIQEAPEDNMPASPDEGGMAKDQLEFMKYAADEIMQHIENGGEFPEWMQNKLSGTFEKMKSLHANIDHSNVESVKEELDLDELKMDDPKLVRAFDKMKKGDTIKLKTSSTISKGTDFVDYVVKSKNVVNKGRVEKITLVTKGNEGSVKKFLYKRDGKVTFAIGDMGASIDDIKEAAHELAEKLKVSDGLGAWITDFQKSDAPQFAGKSDEDRQKMAIAAFTDAGGKLDEMAYKPGSFKDIRPQEKAAKALDALIKSGGLDKSDFQKARAMYVQASDMQSRKKLKDFISNLDTEPLEAILDIIGRNDPDTFQKMYPNSKPGEYLSTIAYKHRNAKNEETELDEKAPKMTYALVGTDMKIYSMGSDERDLRLDRKSLEKRFKDVAPLKMARLKTAQSIGDKVDKSQLKEEEEPNKPDSAKAVDQMRDDKKKTRIAQLQLQIAKASEMINKLNSQEKPDA